MAAFPTLRALVRPPNVYYQLHHSIRREQSRSIPIHQALRQGIVVYMPTPRLRSGFRRFDPARIPQKAYSEAARLSTCNRWAEEVPLAKLPEMDAIVSGSVAVTRDGFRCGKGHGYGDLEYAILRELGYPPVPVATTVHPLQFVTTFPSDPTDLPVSLIVTPTEVISVANPPPPPDGIDWTRLTEEDLRKMPILRELRDRR
jgi:5-formyltetrahydrofolate cyclo-ligase